MNKLIYVALVLWSVMIGCKQNDIEVYGEEPRIEFAETRVNVVFDDNDYIGNITEKTLELKVRSLGYVLKTPLKYVLDTVTKVEGVNFETFYEYPSDAEEAIALVKVQRPAFIGSSKNFKLTFDMENASNDFLAGRLENLNCDITVTYSIRPSGWDENLWGIYSNSKYVFMINHFNKVYAKLEKTKEERNEVSKAYEEYRKKNPPLMDDENPQSEIVFPKD
ncbi:MAG: DUF4843 domain-containing protein [Odoribacter sp.]|nr:DUF4843 domain-containing protein [Odoribacter sp.]MDY3032654.1 DUF4843 domain-containing protein [Odoribacter sp.]